jgi:hypothetical protein
MPIAQELDEVEVKAEKDRNRSKYLRLFENEFLGKRSGIKCDILNTSVIDVYKNGDTLIAKALMPIEIQNKTLGYNILFDLQDFWLVGNSYSIKGFGRFQQLPTVSKSQLKKWINNRATTFNGSLQQFLNELTKADSIMPDYKMYRELEGREGKKRSSYFQTNLIESVKEIFPSQIISQIGDSASLIVIPDVLEIHYLRKPSLSKRYSDIYHQVSWIEISGDTLFLDKHKIPINPAGISTSGDLSLRRISELLPLDYTEQPKNNSNAVSVSAQNMPKPQEKIYLHLNKPYYFPRDTIWYKPYVRLINFDSTDTTSTVLYVELISPDKNIYSRVKLNMKDSPSGVFILPDSVTGTFFIRTYTSWSRNTGLHYVQVPVLSNYQNISASSVVLDDKEGLVISSSKQVYGLREKITLDIQSLDSVLVSSLSISVVDSTLALPWRGNQSILTENFDEESRVDTVFRVEQSLRFSGFIDGIAKIKNGVLVNVFQPSLGYFSSNLTSKHGGFDFDRLNFYDSVSFFFQAINKGKVVSKNIFIEPEHALPIPLTLQGEVIELEDQKTLLRSDGSYKLGKGVTLLNQVEITAKKARSYFSGPADYTINGSDLRPVAPTENLLLGLQGRVPGISVKEFVDFDGSKKVEVRFMGGQNKFFYIEPMVLVDSLLWSGINELNGLSLELIDRIEVKSGKVDYYGPRSSSGVISIITKAGPYASASSIKELQNFKLITLYGYKRPVSFFSPDYIRGRNFDEDFDYRSTLFWGQSILLNRFGKGSVSFFTGDISGTYKCVVEGLINNNPVRGVYFFRVSN